MGLVSILCRLVIGWLSGDNRTIPSHLQVTIAMRQFWQSCKSSGFGCGWLVGWDLTDSGLGESAALNGVVGLTSLFAAQILGVILSHEHKVTARPVPVVLYCIGSIGVIVCYVLILRAQKSGQPMQHKFDHATVLICRWLGMVVTTVFVLVLVLTFAGHLPGQGVPLEVNAKLIDARPYTWKFDDSKGVIATYRIGPPEFRSKTVPAVLWVSATLGDRFGRHWEAMRLDGFVGDPDKRIPIAPRPARTYSGDGPSNKWLLRDLNQSETYTVQMYFHQREPGIDPAAFIKAITTDEMAFVQVQPFE